MFHLICPRLSVEAMTSQIQDLVNEEVICQHINHPKPLASDAVTLVASVAMLRYYMEDILREAERIKKPNLK